MPVIMFEGPKLERSQKADLVRQFSEMAAKVTGIPTASFIVYIKENDRENIGVGGTLLADRAPQPK